MSSLRFASFDLFKALTEIITCRQKIYVVFPIPHTSLALHTVLFQAFENTIVNGILNFRFHAKNSS